MDELPILIPDQSGDSGFEDLPVLAPPGAMLDLMDRSPVTAPPGPKPVLSRNEQISAPPNKSLAGRIYDAARRAISPVVGLTPEQVLAERARRMELPEQTGNQTRSEIERTFSDLRMNEDGSFTETLNPDRTRSPLVAGIDRGIDQLQDIGYGLAQWAATVAGVDTPTLDEWRKANQREIANNPSISPGAAGALASMDPVQIGTMAVESVGENLPMLVPGMGGGAAAGAVAKRTAGKLVGEALAKRVGTAQGVGAAVANTAQELGSIFGDMVDSGKRDQDSALTAVPYAFAAGLLDTLGDKLALGRATEGIDQALKFGQTGKFIQTATGANLLKTIVGKFGMAGAEQFLTEAPTEALQEAVEFAAKTHVDLRDNENFWSNWVDRMTSDGLRRQMFEAGVKGGLGGLGIGVASEGPAVVGDIARNRVQTEGVNRIAEIIGSPNEFGDLPVLDPVATGSGLRVAGDGRPIDLPTLSPVPIQTGVSTVTAGSGMVQSVNAPPPVVWGGDVVADRRFQTGVAGGERTAPEASVIDRILAQHDQAIETQRTDGRREAERTAELPILVPPAQAGFNRAKESSELPILSPVAAPAPVTQAPVADSVPESVAPQPAAQQVPVATPAAEQSVPAAIAPAVETPSAPATPAAVPAAPPAPVTPAPAVVEQPAVPPPAAMRVKVDKSARDKAKREAKKAPREIPEYVAQASSFLDQNSDYATAFAAYQSSPAYQSAIEYAAAGDQGAAIFIQNKVDDAVYKFVAQNLDDAFTEDNEGEKKFDSSSGGFSISKVIRDAKIDYLRNSRSVNNNATATSIDSSATEDGKRSLSETIPAPQPDKHYTQVAVRAPFIRWVNERVKSAGDDVIAGAIDYYFADIVESQVGVGGIDRRGVSQEVLDFIKERPGLIGRLFKEFAASIVTDDVALLDVMSSLVDEVTENVRYLLGGESSMPNQEVRQAVIDLLGEVPPWLRIVDDPGMVVNGRPVKGAFVGTRDGVSILLNAARLSGHTDAVLTLVHEAVHAVWDAPGVRDLSSQLERSVAGDIPGYDAATVLEEIAVRAVADRWASNEQRSLWRKVVGAIRTALKRLFGIRLSDGEIADVILAKAINAMRDQRISDRAVVRYSVGQRRRVLGPEMQVYTKQSQVDEALGVAGLPANQAAGIKLIAGAIRYLVPDSLVATIDQWSQIRINRNDPPATRALQKAQRRAAGYLAKISAIGSMKFAPTDVAGVPIEARFVAANSVLEVGERISRRRERLEVAKRAAIARLNAATTAASGLSAANARVSAAESMAASLMESAREWISAEQSLSGSVDGSRKAAVDALKRTIGLIRSGSPRGVGPALESIATVIGPGMDPVSFLRGESQSGWPSWNGVAPMSQVIFDFLAGPTPALEGEAEAIARIQKYQKNKKAAQEAVENFADVLRMLDVTVKKNPTIAGFAKAYLGVMRERGDAVTEAGRLNSDLRRATEQLAAVAVAEDVLNQITSSPEFRQQTAAAVELTDSARKRFPVTGEVIQDDRNGSRFIFDPVTRLMVELRYSTERDVLDANGVAVSELLKNIDLYINDPVSDPGTVETYRRMVPTLSSIWLANSNVASLTGHVTKVPLTKEWFIGVPATIPLLPLKLAADAGSAVVRGLGHVFGNVIGRDLIYNMLGGTIGGIMKQYMTRSDLMANVIRAAMDSPTFGASAQKIRLTRRVNALQVSSGLSHGRAVARYARDVLDHIYATGDNIGGRPAKVGDVSPGGVVLEQVDFDIAQMGQDYNNYLLYQMRKQSGGALATAPLATEDELWFRNAIDYGTKMKRRRSKWGQEFAIQWMDARTGDMNTGPGHILYRMDLLDDAENFEGAVLKTVATSNPTWKSSDPVQAKAMENRRAMGANWRFASTTEFLQWMGDERARILNSAAGHPVTDAATQESLAQRVLIADLDRAVDGLMSGQKGDTESESRVVGVGTAAVTVQGGRSSFTQPRGMMVAPNGFYEYSLALDEDRLMLNSAAQRVFQVMELNEMGNVISALELERSKLATEERRYIDSRAGRPRFLSRMESRRMEYQDVLAGKRTTTLVALNRVLTHMRSAQKGMQHTLQQAREDESGALNLIRKGEQWTVIQKLLSVPSLFLNQLSGVLMAPMLISHAHNRAKLDIIGALWSMAKSSLRFGGAIFDSAVTLVAGNGPMTKSLQAHRWYWLGMSDFLLDAMARRQADEAYLASIWVQPPMPMKDLLKKWATESFWLAKTSGAVTDRDGSVTEAAFNMLLSPLSMLSNVGGWVNQVGDFNSLRSQYVLYRKMLATLRSDFITAFENRRVVDPVGWANLPIRPFTPEEIGEKSLNSLNYLRDMMSAAGGLEALALDYYQRQLVSPDPSSEPLLRPGVERDVMMNIMARGNIINDSGKGEALKGKGWTGTMRTIGFRFFQFGLMYNEFTRQAISRDVRDDSSQVRVAAANLGLIIGLTSLAAMGLGGAQWLRELQSGKVAATPTLTALATESETSPVTAWAKLFFGGGANIFLPIVGDQISAMISGQQGKNIGDLSALVPFGGIVTGLNRLVRETYQSGDSFYPMVTFMKGMSPAFEAAYNRTYGAAEMPLINAARSFRSAAPDSIETRQVSPGGIIKLSPDSVRVRDAMRAIAADDRTGFNRVVQEAQDAARVAGRDPEAAKDKLMASLKAKSPERTVFGRELTEAERAEVASRMNGSQLEAVQQAGAITTRLNSWVSAARPLGKKYPKARGIAASRPNFGRYLTATGKLRPGVRRGRQRDKPLLKPVR